MPGYENTLTLQEKDGVLTGTVKILRKRGEWKTLALRGERGKTHRFFAPSATDGKVDAVVPVATTPVANVAGRWSVVFTDDQGKPSAGVAELQQAGALVTGTVLTPTGDHRFLAGEVRGEELLLSRFDGGTAFMYKLKLTAKQQELSGHVFYGNWGADAVQARRDASAVLPDASMLTHLRNPGARFDFTFPDLEGKPVSLSDARFNDQVVIVMLGGSWCPNCHDETTFMVPFLKAREGKGLAAVMLMFEHFGDMPQAVQAVKRFQTEFGISYPLLIAGTSDKDDAGTRMPQLDRVYAFPTTLVIDRQGRVRKIHTGFNGPATGEKYTQFQREFSTFIDKLLAEKP
jgi:peroxiredoxin